MLQKSYQFYRVASLLRRSLFAGSDKRHISTELTTALRPFYFAVHPDLFGQHPVQRSVNEDSLKQLSSHMESLYERKYHVLREPKTLHFYIRDNTADSRDTFKLIKITLDRHMGDPKTIITHLLELCNLSTDYIKNVKPNSNVIFSMIPRNSASESGPYQQQNTQSGQGYNYGSGAFNQFYTNFYQVKEENKKSLDVWMKKNSLLAKTRTKEIADLKEEVNKLVQYLVQRFNLRDIRYDCGWNYEHYRGCLKSFERMANLHSKSMALLKGRIVVFAPFTGVSLEGHVMLFTGDVLTNWIEFITNIPKQDAFLKKIPYYENTLSQVLRNIKIGRRKYMPKKQVMCYANYLMKITTTLGDYLTTNKYPDTWPSSLSEYELVVESESGPLMVNPMGQIIVPATCPSTILVDFITMNLASAREWSELYQTSKHIETKMVEHCTKRLRLLSLTKDDSVTSEKMIEALKKLVKQEKVLFQGVNLHVTNYYSLLADGTVCIPWDFFDNSSS